ncbi:hypothetical protein Krac_6958 [Ktedonobacter racemifer DSM 44963]|uniref:Uncharacterized protein n=1 Tax=Ktedonobacter racemifer DSM 44963 TaxID=485913 RepID=D6TQ78_KTERA|nr:hypothetical protein Krac_6958 [Ktedonobacter racemifer DSM 44963]
MVYFAQCIPSVVSYLGVSDTPHGLKTSGFSQVHFLLASYAHSIAAIRGSCHSTNYRGAIDYPLILLYVD